MSDDRKRVSQLLDAARAAMLYEQLAQEMRERVLTGAATARERYAAEALGIVPPQPGPDVSIATTTGQVAP